MSNQLYGTDTPEDVKNAKVCLTKTLGHSLVLTITKGLHLITQSTPNGQKLQIFLEELADAYGTEWTTTLM